MTQAEKQGQLPYPFDLSALEQLNHCNRCGFCLPSCPTYVLLAREPASPRGRLAMAEEVLEGRLALDRHVGEQMFLCLGCRACESACPSGVVFSRVLEAVRAAVEARAAWTPQAAPVRRMLLDHLVTHPARMRLAAALLWAYRSSGMSALARRLGLLRRLPWHLGELEPMVPDLPPPWRWPRPGRRPLARREGRGRLQARAVGGSAGANPGHGRLEGVDGGRPPAGEAALFAGCIMDAFFPKTQQATVRVLEALGVRVAVAYGQGCCGALHAHAGRLEEARALARRNIEAFEGLADSWVVNNAGGCGAMLKEYPLLFEQEPAWRRRAEAFSRRVRDISELLVELGAVEALRRREKAAGRPSESGSPGRPVRVTYQDSCHLRHGQKLFAPPRQLLCALPGYEFVEMPDADRCCGSAGIYTLTHFDISMQLLDARMQQVLRTGAQVVATANPGCFMQMRLGVARAGLSGQIRVAHVVDLVAEALSGPEPGVQGAR